MKKLTAISMALITIFSTLLNASAANVCQYVHGTLEDTVTFTASVGNNYFAFENIKISFSPGVIIRGGHFNSKTTYTEHYGNYYINVYDQASGKTVYSNDITNKKSVNIPSYKLLKNHTYVITVKGYATEHICDGYSTVWEYFKGWSQLPTWTVSKTGKNITFCQ